MRKLLIASCLFVAAASVASACGSPPPPATTTTLPPAAKTASAPPPPPLKLADTGIEPTWMDTTVDPCQSFFAYACGGFVRTAEIPADRASWGTTELIQKENELFLRDVLEHAAADSGGDPLKKKIGDYYVACMDETAIEKSGLTPLRPLLDVIGKVHDVPSLAAAITHLHAASVFPLFDIGAQQDFADATQMIAGLDQDGLGLPDRDYYLKDEGNMKDVRAFYEGHVARILALLGAVPAEAKREAADVMRVETAIAKLQQDKVVRRDPHKVYHRVDRVGLPLIAKTFPWNTYFNELGLPSVQAISVNDPAYFTGIDALMHQESPRAWRAYLDWQLVHSKSRMLPKAFVDEAFAFQKKLVGQKELEPRWKRCVRSVDAGLGELLAQPYVAAKFAGDSRDRARALVGSIHDAMKADLKVLAWMDDATRAAALTKIGELGYDKVGYPDHFRTYDFDVTRVSYAVNALAAEKFELHRQLAKIGKPVDRTQWDITPPTVNAYYDPSMNEIVVPAGELQPPFFSKDFYAPVNIGDEGANTVGHEITHGFDDEGSQFDGHGNLRDWWTPATKTKFEAATKCVENQYSQYDAVPGVKLNGELTAGENIADIGGVKLGYAALAAWKMSHPNESRSVEGFSDEKLFFLAYAQGWCSKETPEFDEMLARSNPHSPPRWRVDGPMIDNPTFASAYACKAGAPMNPGKSCAVW